MAIVRRFTTMANGLRKRAHLQPAVPQSKAKAGRHQWPEWDENDRFLYDAIAHQIEREDLNTNRRLSWSLAFQGFLFAAATLSVWGPESGSTAMFLVSSLAVVGIWFCLLTFEAIEAAAVQHKYLMEEWYQYFSEEHSGPPRPFGSTEGHNQGQSLAVQLPVYIAATWLCAVVVAAIVLFVAN